MSLILAKHKHISSVVS